MSAPKEFHVFPRLGFHVLPLKHVAIEVDNDKGSWVGKIATGQRPQGEH